MAKKKKSKEEEVIEPEPPLFASEFFQTPAFRALSWTLLLGGALAGAMFGWRKMRPEVEADPRFQLTADHIEVTPQPEWIKGDVKADVLRRGRLDELSVLDTKATVKVHNAFNVHTWVAEVIRVRKLDGPRMRVELEYRKPVAMVEVFDAEKKPGLLPVDGNGVLLPPDDFSSKTAMNYLRIAIDYNDPVGGLGVAWGDPRVIGAANIAAIWEDNWQSLGLYRIQLMPTPPSYPREPAVPTVAPQFDLTTSTGARILWGHAPGAEISGEALPNEKIERLQDYIAKNGPLGADGVELDLRNAGSIVTRTARQPAASIQ